MAKGQMMEWKSPAGEENAPAFNAAIAYLQRISNLMTAAHVASLEHNNESYFDNLTQLEVELDSRMNDEQRKESAKLKNQCIKVMNKAYEEIRFIRNEQDGRITQYEYITKLALQNYHKFLSRTAHQLGLVMVNRDNSYRATRIV